MIAIIRGEPFDIGGGGGYGFSFSANNFFISQTKQVFSPFVEHRSQTCVQLGERS